MAAPAIARCVENGVAARFFAVECDSEVEFKGAVHITTFVSSKRAERGFCSKCGTHLFYRLKQDGHHAIPVGFFDGDNKWRFTVQIFIDQKPSFYSFADKRRISALRAFPHSIPQTKVLR